MRCPWTDIKKDSCRYGKIEIAGRHLFSQAVHGFQISPYMQEKMVCAGFIDCYKAASEMLSRFLLIAVSTIQVQRLTNTYGRLLESDLAEQKEPEVLPLKADEVVYAPSATAA
ncbi:MAG: hypothetical protein ICV84_14360 [Flavisolibacter sp.]|nr:hypothetical protein [Flavisolibacter sp.]